MGTNQECLFRNEDLLPFGHYRTDFELELYPKPDAGLARMTCLDFDLAPSATVELQWALSVMTDVRSEKVPVMFDPARTAS